MPNTGADSSCLGYCGLYHTLLKGSLVSYRIDSTGAGTQIGDISIAGTTGKKASGVIRPHPGKLVVYVAEAPDKERDPGDILVISLTNGRLLKTLSGHTRKVTHLIWAEGRGLVSGSADGTCRLWLTGGDSRVVYDTERTKTFLGDTDPETVVAIAISSSGKLLVGNQSGSIEVITLTRNGHSTERLLPLWKDRRPVDVPQAALDAYEVAQKLSKQRFERKKKERTIGETSSEERQRKEKENEKEQAEFEPTNKRPLAKLSGDTDNSICCLISMDKDAVAASTTRGEILVVKGTGYESIIAFRKSYAGCLVAGYAKGEPRLYAGNRGYDAAQYEIVIMSMEPLRQLKRICPIDDNNMIVNMHWCSTANRVLIAKDEAGLFSLDPDGDEPVRTVFEKGEAHQDSMDEEGILAFVDHSDCVLMRTSWGRVRRLKGPDLKEMDALGTVFVGSRTVCVNPETGAFFGIRGSGYDDFKVDMAIPGVHSWKRLTGYQWPDTSRSFTTIEDNPPAYVAYLEYTEAPAGETRGMVVVGGEMGGLYQVNEPVEAETPTFSSFQGAPVAGVQVGIRETCVAWDKEGALIMSRIGSGVCSVWSWSPKKFVGNITGTKGVSLMARIKHQNALVATWDKQHLLVFDLRARSAVEKFTLGEDPSAPRCLLGAEESFLFAYCSKSVKEGSSTKAATTGELILWPLTSQSQEQGSDVRALALLESGEARSLGTPIFVKENIEFVTSMLIVPGVGLLTAHSKVVHGVSVWCPGTGVYLYRIKPEGAGGSIKIMNGPGSRCVVWNIVGGKIGYLKWNNMLMLEKTYLEDGLPSFSPTTYFMFLLEVFAIFVSVGQIASFALSPPWGDSKAKFELILPGFFKLQIVQRVTNITEKLQGINIPHVPWIYEYYAALTFVIMFVFLYIGQESLEMRSYIYPGSWWSWFYRQANTVSKICVQTAALPALTYLIGGVVCHEGAMEKLQNVKCMSRTHLLYYICPAVLVALLLQFLCFRFARVGYHLSNLDVGWNLFDLSHDVVPEESTPNSLITPMSNQYQNLNIVTKSLLKVFTILAPAVRKSVHAVISVSLMPGLDTCMGIAINCGSMITEPFVMRPQGSWFQPCSLQFAMDTANAWMFVSMFFSVLVSSKVLPSGEWLDMLSYFVLIVFPIGYIARRSLYVCLQNQKSCCQCTFTRSDGYTELTPAAS